MYHRYGILMNMASSSSDWPVHQLWPLSGVEQRTKLDVVFFHGLQLTSNDVNDSWTTTWTQRGHHDVCWPREWLAFDLGQAVRIFSVSYNAHVEASPHDHVSEIADNLFQNFMDRRYEWRHPIVLIGHSVGGLVLKSLIVKLERVSTARSPNDSFSEDVPYRAKAFLRNVRGVAFYAVPHAGSTNIPIYYNKLLRCKNRYDRGILGNLKPWRRDMNQLSVDFDRIVTGNEISIYAFCEGMPMEQMGILVHFSSAQRSAGDNCYKVEDANHMEVCKPPSKEHPSYGLLLQFINTCQKVAREREVHDLPQETFGLDSYVERLETLLTSEGSDAAPRYVGVWGMGGVGKTLLLQKVYGSHEVESHFQGADFIWLTVGQTPDIMALYRTLSKKLRLDPKLHANPEDYKRYLHTRFIQKRVFLVLDDVWKAKVFDSLDLAKGEGSVTLLSTRNQSVLERASPKISQEYVTPLSKEDSWSLFRLHAFGPASYIPDDIKKFAQSMALECEGLPLALKVIGEAMFGQDSGQWEQLLKKLTKSRMQERTVEEHLYERLRLGYDLLSEEDGRLKQCFHYFAAFPNNSNIIFEEILFHWTANGLVPEHDEDDPRAEALSLLRKLRKRSFIESSGQSGSDQYYVLDFKVHDVMRDLAFYVVQKDCATEFFYRAGEDLGEVPKDWKTLLKARTISLHTNKLKRLSERFCAPNLVSLLLGRNAIVSLSANFSSNFPMLSVLNLSNGQFQSLPAELGDLENLVFLDLSNCHDLSILPDTVCKLRELKSLILDDCWNLKYLPSGMVDLTSLQVLHTAHCGNLRWAEHTLSRTASTLLEYSTVGASLEDICRLFLLTELTIFAEDPHPLLDNFNLPQNELPHNISSLTELRILQVWVDIITLPAGLCRCIHLQELELGSWMLEHLPRSFTRCGAFPALIRLKLFCYELVEFPKVDQGALPKLRTIDFNGCQSLESLPLSLEVLPNFSTLIVDECTNTLKNSCRTNCRKSSTWRNWNIKLGLKNTSRYEQVSALNLKMTSRYEQVTALDLKNIRQYTFNANSKHTIESVHMHLQWKMKYYERTTIQYEKN